MAKSKDEDEAKSNAKDEESKATGIFPFFSDVVAALVGSIVISMLATNWVVFTAIGSTPAMLDIVFPVGGETCTPPCLNFPNKATLEEAQVQKEIARRKQMCSVFGPAEGCSDPCTECTKSQAFWENFKIFFHKLGQFLKSIWNAFKGLLKSVWNAITSIFSAIA